MRTDWSTAALGAVTLPLVQSCTDVCACPPLPAVAVVTGGVTLGDAPAPGAQVRAYSAAGADCISLDVPFDGATAGSDGGFSLTLVSGSEDPDTCVYVYARPAGSGDDSRNSDTTFVTVDFSITGTPDTVQAALAVRGP
jgi:hypothetical protein